MQILQISLLGKRSKEALEEDFSKRQRISESLQEQEKEPIGDEMNQGKPEGEQEPIRDEMNQRQSEQEQEPIRDEMNQGKPEGEQAVNFVQIAQ